MDEKFIKEEVQVIVERVGNSWFKLVPKYGRSYSARKHLEDMKKLGDLVNGEPKEHVAEFVDKLRRDIASDEMEAIEDSPICVFYFDNLAAAVNNSLLLFEFGYAYARFEVKKIFIVASEENYKELKKNFFFNIRSGKNVQTIHQRVEYVHNRDELIDTLIKYNRYVAVKGHSG